MKARLTREERKLFTSLRTPAKIQDFLETLPLNFEETYRSPREVLRAKKAHCFEGACLAAAILWFQGEAPLLLDLVSKKGDDDHVVTLFRKNKKWGAISKTNHAVLRFRDPIYETVRELALSYFHEYFLDSGAKTLVSFSEPFDIAKTFKSSWVTSIDELDEMALALDRSPHTTIVPRGLKLRLADNVEREAGKIVTWKKS